MKKVDKILKTTYEALCLAKESQSEIYDCGEELTVDERNQLINIKNAMDDASLKLHQLREERKRR